MVKDPHNLEDKLYNSDEVAKILGVSLRSIYRYIDEGKLKYETKTAAGKLLFTKQEILDFLYPPSNIYHYYQTPLKDLKEIAGLVQNFSLQEGKPYAFTLYGGLSLHYEIKPFSKVHLYISPKDLPFWIEKLQLQKVDKDKASICLIEPSGPDVLKNAYELKGLKVVSNDQLLKDLFTYSKESKKLAEEFKLSQDQILTI